MFKNRKVEEKNKNKWNPLALQFGDHTTEEDAKLQRDLEDLALLRMAAEELGEIELKPTRKRLWPF